MGIRNLENFCKLQIWINNQPQDPIDPTSVQKIKLSIHPNQTGIGKNFNKMKKIDRRKLRHENRPKTTEKDGKESQVMFNAQAENIGEFSSIFN